MNPLMAQTEVIRWYIL